MLGDVDHVHPFRDGNGRTQLQYLKQLAARAGHVIDLTRIGRAAWLDASRRPNAGDHEAITLCIRHGGGPGVEKIAARWAERNGVHQVVCKPDWNAHGRAAPFRRNDELLNLLPKGVIAFPGSGITDNLVDKARQLGIPVHRCNA